MKTIDKSNFCIKKSIIFITIFFFQYINSTKNVVPKISNEFISSLVWSDENVSIVSEFKADNAYMMLIKDKKGNLYLIKQKKDYTEDEIAKNVIMEALGAYIAGQLNVPSQVVLVVPATVDMPGKKYRKRVASLHSYIPNGEEFTKDLALRGIFKECQFKPCPKNSLRSIFQYLSKNIKLVDLFALDTFIGLRSRRKRNLLYVKEKNTCYAIDMGSAFRINYPELINEVVKTWIKKKEIFNNNEQKALKRYTEVLQKALVSFPPEYIIQMCHLLFEKLETSAKEYDALGLRKEMIRQIYASVTKLVDTLEVLIATF